MADFSCGVSQLFFQRENSQKACGSYLNRSKCTVIFPSQVSGEGKKEKKGNMRTNIF